MFGSFLHPSRSSRRASNHERSNFASPYRTIAHFNSRKTSSNQRRSITPDTSTNDDSQEGDDEDEVPDIDTADGDDYSDGLDEDGPDDSTPLLPIFSAAHLDGLPIYTLTHTVRLMVASRVETTLSWEQLRSPQVSQFLLKPIQQEIRSTHFSAATEYALIANCLQFTKEVDLHPGNSGTSRTRAMVCELLAIRLLREHSMRELIDSLCYDFNPLQGQDASEDQDGRQVQSFHPSWDTGRRSRRKIALISCLEVAIRAQAKRFLAHPLVVQLLNAVWSGSIVFHAAADSMHRKMLSPDRSRAYGTHEHRLIVSSDSLDSPKHDECRDIDVTARKAVTLYNPRDASLFKLSRLRVPRYRNLLSTCSFAVLLALFLAVLIQRSLEITTLEVIFWFWGAGYMLDEIVGFNEQGFSLYIASFWNTFDVGILMVLFVHLCLRIYGIIMPDARKHTVANMAYDILAADAILLFPRLFSVLDHYRYFSQLLIAFRMMAADLVAVCVLIVISCSGFFAALTLSFGNEGIDTPSSVAYALLQMLMGFTPAAWDRWGGYNALGKTILTLFLFICHFLVVTILITVLTNSFMAVVQNANEEHQFVFAVNTLSMVKSDALFSYVAPTNILAWAMTPLRYFLPFRQYLKVNRTVIKITHFPILFSIYLYERTFLQPSAIDAIDLVQPRGRSTHTFIQKIPRLAREPSVATFRQDRALEEVFRRPLGSTVRSGQQGQGRKTSTIVSNWMRNVDEATASPPAEQERKFIDPLERPPPRQTSRMAKVSRDFAHSVASDPEEVAGNTGRLPVDASSPPMATTTPSKVQDNLEVIATESNSKLATESRDDEKPTPGQQLATRNEQQADETSESGRLTDYFSIPIIQSLEISEEYRPASSSQIHSRPLTSALKVSDADAPDEMTMTQRPSSHLRNASSTTVVYKPVLNSETNPSSSGSQAKEVGTSELEGHIAAPPSGTQTPSSKPASSGTSHKVPKRLGHLGPRIRPLMPPKGASGFQSAPNLAGLLEKHRREDDKQPRRSALEMDLVSDIGDNKAIGGGYVGALPSSLASHLARDPNARGSHAEWDEDRDMFGRIMMTRMNTLEESVKEIVHEMRDHIRRERSKNSSRSESQGDRRERVTMPAPSYQTSQLRKSKGKRIWRIGDTAEASQASTDGSQTLEDGIQKGLAGSSLE